MKIESLPHTNNALFAQIILLLLVGPGAQRQAVPRQSPQIKLVVVDLLNVLTHGCAEYFV